LYYFCICKLKRLIISLPKQLVNIIDLLAKKEYYSSRSDLIRAALLSYIETKKRWLKIFSHGKETAKKSKIKEKKIENFIDDYRKNL
jgi:metal-responsive CopG/Arc/MetJ family transcriptional regulator